MIRLPAFWTFIMPELPEVETVARTLRPHVLGRRITGVQILRESCVHPLGLPLAALAGATIKAVGRRGKLLLLHLTPERPDGAAMLVIHLRMTGRVLPQNSLEAPHKHTRCIFSLAAGESGPAGSIFFDDARTFGKILAATPAILDRWDFWRSMGPEPLEMTAADLARRLTGKRPLKQALLDQKVIAGIGNIYADESLFRSGLSPLRETGSLSAAETKRLLEAIQGVLRLSIEQCGSSIRDYRDADGNVGAFQNSFQAYGRGGQPCVVCGAPMQKTRLGGRATVFCPNCQRG